MERESSHREKHGFTISSIRSRIRRVKRSGCAAFCTRRGSPTAPSCSRRRAERGATSCTSPRWYGVSGFDKSKDMLAIARAKLPSVALFSASHDALGP